MQAAALRFVGGRVEQHDAQSAAGVEVAPPEFAQHVAHRGVPGPGHEHQGAARPGATLAGHVGPIGVAGGGAARGQQQRGIGHGPCR